MSNQTKEKKLKRILSLEKNLADSFNDSGINVSFCEKEIKTPSSSPLASIANLPARKELTQPVNLCWAPKRPRMISRLTKVEVTPVKLFQDAENVEENDENDENDENRKSPEPKPISNQQIQLLMMAPRRPIIPRSRNHNLRPVRLFQNIMDQGYITDEDPQSEGSENNFSFSPGKFPTPIIRRQLQ